MLKEQHTNPCELCPFRRSSVPIADDKRLPFCAPPEKFIGQINGAYWLPCRSHLNTEDPNWKSTIHLRPQCAGAAIFRANLGIGMRYADPILKLPADPVNVFATFFEFYAHHRKISLQEAEHILRNSIGFLTELADALTTMEGVPRIAASELKRKIEEQKE